jgi:hypothetical protein
LGTPYRGCLACGKSIVRGNNPDAKSIKAQQENVLKNRDSSAKNVKKLTVSDIRDPANDKSFFPDMAVEVTGYVASVVKGGYRETANCGRTDLTDVMINIVASPEEAGNKRKYVVFEISPRWESKLGLNDSNYQQMLGTVKQQIEGKWVTFRGWMFYDFVHIAESESTNPGNASNWRATLWEIHPVTYYKVSSSPPRDGARSVSTGNMRRGAGRVLSISSGGGGLHPERPPLPYLKQWKDEKNHSRREMSDDCSSNISKCFRCCRLSYADDVRDCASSPDNVARQSCHRNARNNRSECRYRCAEPE